MSTKRHILVVAAVLVAAVIPLWWFGFHGQRPDLILFPPADDEAIFEALARPVTLEVRDEPLSAALRHLARKSGVAIEADTAVLQKLRRIPPVSGSYAEWPVAAILDDLAGQLPPEVVVGIGQERVLITSESAWRSGLNNYVTRVHRLDRLLAASSGRMDENAALRIVVQAIDPLAWQAGGAPSIETVPGGLLVVQTPRYQRNIAALLEALAENLEDPARTEPIWIDPPKTAGDVVVEDALKRHLSIDLRAVPLDKALQRWSRDLKIPIQVDRAARPRLQSPETVRLRDLPLESSLRLLLEARDLTFHVRHGRLWISKSKDAKRYVSLRVLPAAIGPSHADHFAQYLGRCVRRTPTSDPFDDVKRLVATEGSLVVREWETAHRELEELLPSPRPASGREDERLAGHDVSTPVEQALRRPVTWQQSRVTLREVARQLHEKYRVNVWINESALSNTGHSADMNVALDAHNEPLEVALRRMLRPRNLRLTVRHGVLVFTTPEEDKRHEQFRGYRLTRLLHASLVPGTLDEVAADPASLIELIEQMVAPESWSRFSPPTWRDTLPVRRTRGVHQAVGGLLGALEKASASCEEAQSWTVAASKTYARAARAFARPADLAFESLPLDDVVRTFEDALQIPIELPDETLLAAGITRRHPVTADCRGRDLGTALAEILAAWNLSLALDGRRLRIDSVPERLLRVHRIGWLPDDELANLPLVVESLEAGPEGAASPVLCKHFDRSAVIRATLMQHYRIDRRLEAIRGFVSREHSPHATLSLNAAGVERSWRALDEPVDLVAGGEPLREVLAQLSRELPVPLRIAPDLDRDAAAGGRFSQLEDPLHVFAAGVPLGTLLDAVLRGRSLSFVADERGLTISESGANAASRHVQGMYHVEELDEAMRAPRDVFPRLPLPEYLQPEAAPYGCLQFEPLGTGRKQVPDGSDPLLEILRRVGPQSLTREIGGQRVEVLAAHSADGRFLRLGPAVWVAQPTEPQRESGRLLRLLRERLAPAAETSRGAEQGVLQQAVSLSADNLPRKEALRRLAEQQKLGLLIEPSAFGPRDSVWEQKISVHVENAQLDEALRRVLPETAELRVVRRGGSAVVMSVEVAGAEFVWRTFDVRDLAERYGPRGELMLAQWLSHLAPYSWRHDPSTTLCCLPGWIVAHHSRGVQHRVEGLLEVLRDDEYAAYVALRPGTRRQVRARLRVADDDQQSRAVDHWIRAGRNARREAERDVARLILCHLEDPLPAALDWLASELWGLAERSEPDAERLFTLCRGVRNFGHAAHDAVEPLSRLLDRSRDRAERDELIAALVATGPDASPRLMEVAATGAYEDREAILRAVRNERAPYAVAVLLYLLAETEESDVLEALSEVDKSGTEVHRLLGLWSRDSDVLVRRRAERLRPVIEGLFGMPRPESLRQ